LVEAVQAHLGARRGGAAIRVPRFLS
jgi:hypothetical protein